MNGSLIAHTLERIGLAMAGGSCGLFVFSCIAKLADGAYSYPSVMVATMLIGGLGFYLGIDLPPPHRPRPAASPSTIRLMSAIGTLLTGLAALTAMAVIIREITGNSDIRLLYTIAACWFVGAFAQIFAGIGALTRRARTAGPPQFGGYCGEHRPIIWHPSQSFCFYRLKMHLSVINEQKKRARAWFEILRHQIFGVIERLDADACLGLYKEPAGCFVRTPWERTDRSGAAGGGGVRAIMKS